MDTPAISHDAHRYDTLPIPRAWARDVHPAWNEVRIGASALVVRTGALPSERVARFERLRLFRLSGYLYPDATPERLQICTDVMSYFFLLDEIADEDPSIGKRPDVLWQRVSDHMFGLRYGAPGGHGRGADDPLGRLMLDIRARLVAMTDHAWLSRFAMHMRDYLMEGAVSAAVHWAAGEVPAPGVYATQRAHDVAGYPAQDLIELSGGYVLPEELRRHPTAVEMRMLCTRVVAHTNDLLSWATEAEVGNPNNLLEVLRVHAGMSLAEAKAHIVERIRADVTRFESLAAERICTSDLTTRLYARFVAGQRALMRGNLDWSLESSRYGLSQALLDTLGSARPSPGDASPGTPSQPAAWDRARSA